MKKTINIYKEQPTYEIEELLTNIINEFGIVNENDKFGPKKEGVIIIEFIEK